jgi:hypothetical protein
LRTGYLPGLQATSPPVKGIDLVDLGAFRLSTRWSYSMPYFGA